MWLSLGSIQQPIEALLLEMLKPQQSNPVLQQAVLEELDRPAKHSEVVFEYLGLREVGRDLESEVPLVLVSPKFERNPWREALLQPGGDCPIGVVVNTSDHGRLVLIHEVFAEFSEPQKALVRQYAALATKGERQARIVAALRRGSGGIRRYVEMVTGARQRVQSLDPSVLFSPDGEIRVQLGSPSQTTRNLLREGLRGEQVFILPRTLFERGTNYGDIEFLIYLNFFVLQGRRTRIVGTARQRRALERVLRLVIFGLFNPEAKRQPSFEQLHETYGVPDRETYTFLRTAYETYGVRNGGDLESSILGVAHYMNFAVLGANETVIPVYKEDRGDRRKPLAEVRVTPCAEGDFEVRIVQADGRSTAKRLAVTAPRRTAAVVPEAQRRAMQFGTDRPGFGVTPLGTSHGFDPAGDMTSFVIWINGRGILVDPSPEALAYLEQSGVAPVDIPYVVLTHIHADHDGGLLEKLLSGRQTTVIAPDVVFHTFVEKAQLITGHNVEQEGLIKHVSANPGTRVTIEIGGEVVTLESRWNLHPVPTNGFKLSFGGRTFGYSGDTQYDPGLIKRLRQQGTLSSAQYEDLLYFFWTADGKPKVDLLYHEAGIPPIHTAQAQLQALPAAMKRRTFLVHIADKDVAAGAVPGKPPLFATHVLLPSTARSRHQNLLETLRLVCYLYDIPAETLEELLRGAVRRYYSTDEVIIRQGPVKQGEPLYFYVVADGEVAVKDGRRLIARLVKTDSYGEWSISHQRGFRTANVVATRPTQCLQFTDAQYRWLVTRHPVIQERVGKIRRWLPRLELAQAEGRLKAATDPSAGRSVIADMTIGQLSGFAIFSEVRAFKAGQAVVVKGEEADGFYILLSGHLMATMDGRMVGELHEGEVFGEMGLLEGGRRWATVAVVSDDAEVLFMSRRNFHALLQVMPAFSWGIRETAAYRREVDQWRKSAL